MFIDTHAHLEDEKYDLDRAEVLKRASRAGVGHIITVGTELGTVAKALRIAEENENVSAVIGIHPHNASSADTKAIAEIEKLLNNEKVAGIGETGLDYHYDLSPRPVQQEVMRKFIRLAVKKALPLVLHCREAEEDCIKILREEHAQEAGGVLHCFNGSRGMLKAALELGFYIAVGGAVTFPKAKELREAVKDIPLTRLLLETDCPYLAPQSVRGKRNEPAFLIEIAGMVASAKGATVEEIETASTINAGYLFGIGLKGQGKIVYEIRDQLYLNITNRCSNHCTFCIRNGTDFVKGHNLRLKKEPTAAQVLSAAGDVSKYREVVFCGYGEPLIRLSAVKEIAKGLKDKGAKVRIDTNGQANMIHGRSIAKELKGLVDSVSVSLIASDAVSYQKMCVSQYGLDAYSGLKQFVLDAKENLPEVSVTFVTVPGVDTDKCKEIAEKELGVKYRIREYGRVG
ncbi:MAG: TatD family hydrolase [Candidatus Firestonebacteria bacterium]